MHRFVEMSNLTIYRSSAGSGKTYTLVKEFLLIVLCSDNSTEFRKVLAITFTNKAATELKERIIKQLSGLAGLDKLFADDALRRDLMQKLQISEAVLGQRSSNILEKVIYNYGDLAVSTIDKFVVKILRYFNRELGVNPDFAIELNIKLLMRMSVERVMSKIGRDKVLTDMALSYTEQKSDSNKSWRIDEDLFKIALFLKEEESQLAISVLQEYDEGVLLNFFKSIRKTKKELDDKLDVLGKECQSILSEHEDLNKDMYKNVWNFFKTINSETKNYNLYPSPSVVKNINTPTWYKKAVEKKVDITESIDFLRDRLFPKFEEFQKISGNLILQNLWLQSFPPLMFSKRINTEVEALKEEQNVVLISDNNKMISDVLQNNPSPFIYEKLGERYAHFMIDEFQDTSIVQWQNLIPLVEESLGQGKKNVLVGDSKQSIYRFRGGEMEQLSQLPKIFKGNEGHALTENVFKNNLKVESLAYNFRSKKEVVSFNNDLFKFILERKSERVQTLYENYAQKPMKPEGGMVRISILEKTDDEIMLETVNDIIQESLIAGYSYGDIAILVYKNSTGQEVAEYCKERSIPVVSNESLLLKNNDEVSFVLNLLQHILEPSNNKHKLNLLNYLHLKYYREMERHSFLVKYLNSDGHFEEVFKAINVHLIYRELLRKDVYSLCELLCKKFEINSSEAYMLEFLNICSGFARKDKGDVSSFMDYWSINKKKFALQMAHDESAINIMSVHKSKGLEFPVVINLYYFKKFKDYSKDYLWVYNKEEKVPLNLLPVKKLSAKTEYAGMIEEEEYKTSIDQLNALYVATTRAAEVLHVVVPTPASSALSTKKNRIDCLLYNFAKGKENLDGLAQWGELEVERKDKQEIEANLTLENYDRLDWRSDIRIAIGDELKGEELTFGNRLHGLIAETNSRDDIESALVKFQRSNFLSDDKIDEIRSGILSVFNMPQFQRWHDNALDVINEKEILQREGKNLRPDRIFILKDEVIVVDFKTGIERASNKKQVTDYVNALFELGYNNVRGFLLYTREQKLIEISA
ncbi:MAG: ATP-dependent exoDNAse (exonuclease V) beta subunit [Patiriisocius sp.]|jgi:ATP-dependent exoDNAse (exonuclease V) beta subunit